MFLSPLNGGVSTFHFFSLQAYHWLRQYWASQGQGKKGIGPCPNDADFLNYCKGCQITCQSCYKSDLQELSIRAAQQIGLIVGVCMLCIILYLMLILIEKVYFKFFEPDKNNKSKPW